MGPEDSQQGEKSTTSPLIIPVSYFFHYVKFAKEDGQGLTGGRPLEFIIPSLRRGKNVKRDVPPPHVSYKGAGAAQPFAGFLVSWLLPGSPHCLEDWEREGYKKIPLGNLLIFILLCL